MLSSSIAIIPPLDSLSMGVVFISRDWTRPSKVLRIRPNLPLPVFVQGRETQLYCYCDRCLTVSKLDHKDVVVVDVGCRSLFRIMASTVVPTRHRNHKRRLHLEYCHLHNRHHMQWTCPVATIGRPISFLQHKIGVHRHDHPNKIEQMIQWAQTVMMMMMMMMTQTVAEIFATSFSTSVESNHNALHLRSY
jgi:hypothetical protein